MSVNLHDLIQNRAFGVARTIGGDEFALSPSWFVGKGDGLGDLDELFEGDDGEPSELPELHRLFERDAGGLSLMVKAGESGGKMGSRHTDFVASTADVDRMGDIVDQKTWRLAAWRSNPVILHEHGGGFFSAPSLHSGGVVGRGTAKLNRELERLEIRVFWDEADVNQLGQLMAHQHANGFRRAMSVGFMPGKAINRSDLEKDDPRRAPEGTPEWRAGHVFSHNELLESSTVGVPANRAAIQLSQHLQGADLGDRETARKFITETVSSKFTDNLLSALQDEGVRKAILAMVWATPEPKPEPKGLPNLHNLFGA